MSAYVRSGKGAPFKGGLWWQGLQFSWMTANTSQGKSPVCGVGGQASAPGLPPVPVPPVPVAVLELWLAVALVLAPPAPKGRAHGPSRQPSVTLASHESARAAAQSAEATNAREGGAGHGAPSYDKIAPSCHDRAQPAHAAILAPGAGGG